MIFHSIRWRLQAWHGIILVVVLGAFGFSAYQVAHENQLRRIDWELEQRLMALTRPRRPEPSPESMGERPGGGHRGGGRPFDAAEFQRRMREAIQRAIALEGQTNTYYLLWQEDGTILARSVNAPAKVPMPERPEPDQPQTPAAGGGPDKAMPFGPGPPQPSVARTRGEVRELCRFFPQGDCLLVGRSIAADQAAMRHLALWRAAAGGAVLLLGLAGGWWVASRAIRPIDDISGTAMKIAAGDLSQRINAADAESELGRLAGVLNSTFARLEAAFAHQARFTADASHELRTPVSVIVAQTQSALARERTPGEYREALEACRRAAQRMRSLTESLLQLARLDAGQEPMKRERLDLAQVTAECVELVRPLAAERGIQIQSELAPAEYTGDPGRISQVVTNLLSNAIHFNRDQGQVRLRTWAENGSVLLSVADTGEGIPAEDLPHIFERFYRVDKSRSRVQGRTGLGLAICKAIVDAHSGSVDVVSQPGTGSTFTVKLPLTVGAK